MSQHTTFLHPASRLEQKVSGLWLRERDGDRWRPRPLTARADTVAGLRWTWRERRLEDRKGWAVDLIVTNGRTDAVDLDVVYVTDPALSDPAVLEANRLYPSQYLDLTPVDLGRRGAGVAVRQNMPGPAAPWALVGSYTPTVGWATDAAQLLGRGLPEGAPWPGLRGDLPSVRLQGEHAAVALQTAPARLSPGESWRGGFFVVLEADHPGATSAADAAYADGLEAPEIEQAEPERATTSLVEREAAPVECRALSAAEVDRLLPGPRLLVEELDSAPVSWFDDTGAHVVTAAKQRAVLRPHGQILRPLLSLVPDEADVTCTVWMDGGFCSHLTQGHAALGRILAAKETPLGIGRIHGVRIAVDLGAGWQLLGSPSAWVSAVDSATWLYAVDDRILRLHTTAPSASDGRIAIRLEVVQGAPVPALVMLAFDWVGAPGVLGRISVGSGTAEVAAPAGSAAAEAAAGARLEISLPEGADVGDDAVLFSDGVSRGEPVLTLRVPPAGGWELGLLPLTCPHPAPVAGEPGGWPQVKDRITLAADGAPGLRRLVERIDAATGWFGHDALVHYLSPRGLEQHTGGAWGTRDVSQGPVGLLRAWAEYPALRRLLLLIFRAQHERGDWPQAFDFLPTHRRDVVATSHGDVVYWPLLALGQYLTDTGDLTILDEQVDFTGDGAPGGGGSMRDHVVRALDAIEATFVAGTSLPAYGHGDWNDSLQPADPALARDMVSSWTVVLQTEALTTLAVGLSDAEESLAGRAAGIAAAGAGDLRRNLIVDGVVAGYAVHEADGGFTPLIHPRDSRTGLTYSLLPMVHAIAGDVLTPAEARHHLEIIDAHLTGPDGARLFDRPVRYSGGPMETFQRAEAASYFGREIGLMYTHAHLRHAEALARHGDGPGLLQALAKAVPIGIKEQVPTAAPRQANTYASSSDAAFADRYEAAERYGDIAAGRVPLEGGWRVYSSGPGLFLELLVTRLLGVRHAGAEIELDPVVDPAAGVTTATVPLLGRAMRLVLVPGAAGHGVGRVEVDGVPLEGRRLENPYRPAGVAVPAEALRRAAEVRVTTR